MSWLAHAGASTTVRSGRASRYDAATAASIEPSSTTGPMFGYSDTWQLVINTGTTIVTFLMVFLIQNTQNRDAMAVQVKLAELIIAVEGAHNKLANCEEMSEEELTELHEQYRQQASVAKQALDSRRDGQKAKSGSRKAMADS